MKRSTWPLIAILAVFTLGVVSALAITNHAKQQAVIRTQAATSAATSITLFLVMILLGLALLAAGVVGISCWLKQRQEREKMQRALRQAQIYALLQGARSPRTSDGRAGVPGLDQANGNIIVFPGGSQQPAPQLTTNDLRAMMSGQPDLPAQTGPLASHVYRQAGLLPPDAGGWEVM